MIEIKLMQELAHSASRHGIRQVTGENQDVEFHCSRYLSVGSSRVDLQACKLEYSIVSPK